MTHRIRIIFCAALLGCFIGTASVRPALAFNIDIGAIADAVTNIMMDRAKSGWEKIQGKVKQDVGAFNQDAGNYPSSPDIVSRTSGGQPGAKQVAEVPGSGKQAMGGQPGLDNAGRKAQLAAQDAGASAMVLPLADHFGFEMLAAQRLGTVSLQMDNLIETNHFGFETIKTTITEMQKAMLGEIAKILDSLDMKEDVRVAHTDLIENVKANQVDAGNMCKAVSGLIAARAAEEVTRHKRIQRGNKTNAWFSGADPITKQGSVTSNAHTFDRWINLYCDPDGFHDSREDVDNSKLCGAKREEIKNLELDKKGQPKLVNADVRPGVTLFTRKTFPNEAWDNAAEDLIKNLVNASPIEPMALANLSDSNAPQDILARRMQFARYNLASDSLNSTAAMRERAIQHKAWAEAMGAPVSKLLDKATKTEGDQISEWELLDILMSKMYMDPQWMLSLAESEANVARTNTQVNAFNLTMQWRIYNLLERLIAIEAVQLAMQVENQRR